METPVQIVYRDMPPSDALEAKIRERADKLRQFHPDLLGCRVTVEAPHKRHHQGKLYRVTVDVTLPGEDVRIRRAPAQHQAHEDAYVAVRDAFDAARRRVEDTLRRRRGHVKRHTGPSRARVARLFPEEGYGFLETDDGREIYFHQNSVVRGSFGRLVEGSEVRFVEEMGAKGPQASTVEPVGRGKAAS